MWHHHTSIVRSVYLQPIAGQGRWQEAVPLLSQSQEALYAAFGADFEALGEADFYLALKQVTEATEVNLADINGILIEVIQLH